jgi:hypothetical protein
VVSGVPAKTLVVVDKLVIILDISRNEKDEGNKLRCDPLKAEWLLLQHKHIRIAMSPMLNVVAKSGVIRVWYLSDAIRHIVRSQAAQRFDLPAALKKVIGISPPPYDPTTSACTALGIASSVQSLQLSILRQTISGSLMACRWSALCPPLRIQLSI